jgi:LCP family protein required for cell wall assembly
MSDTSVEFYTRQAAEARGPEPPGRPRRKKRKKLKRILIGSGVSLALLAGGLVATAYTYVNNLASQVHRIHVAALTAKYQPPERGGSLTILLTDTQVVPGQDTDTGLIELLHLNADQHSGGVVSFPANAFVRVPGHGRMELGNTLAIGGPSLMIETIEDLTGVRIDHYSAIDFAGLPSVVGALGGVFVQVPYTVVSMGYTFPAGTDELNANDALAYVRQPAVSEIGREYLQENLLRAILDKIARGDLFRPGRDIAVLKAVVAAISVDSDLSNSALEHLAERLSYLRGRDGTFVDAAVLDGSPTRGDDQPVYLNNRIDWRLWQAIRDDNIAGFAQQYPFTITPNSPG